MPIEKARLYQNVVMKLSVLRYMVKSQSKAGKTDLNRDCESFFRDVLNLVYGYSLVNLNDDELNHAAIDLADDSRRLCIQVTATSAVGKLQETMQKFVKHGHDTKYDRLVFLMLADKKNYQPRSFEEFKGKSFFDCKKDVWDIDDVLSQAEKGTVDELKALSDYLDAQLPSITRAIAPTSLLAQAEQVVDKPAKTAAAFLTHFGHTPGAVEWAAEFTALQRLYKKLQALSKNQREFLSFITINGTDSQFKHRRSMVIQTVTQRLQIGEAHTREYYVALEAAGLIEVDSEDRAKSFELTFELESGCDAFTLLQEYLATADKITKAIVDCDFSILD
ncbi:SMEK domain-containing protein [Pelomonas sp. P7]|uniref:SMEK domain-containing protein n=1 Tax=Pelomonas caseinilytica TaxID=2906763 RepID=A0ABS8XM30_9BURK|nr:SMEK domain-containing protein [Pelomonas sp. P7]MCE4540770.1 SMEK domain-containing protein [Pelomonas sp. P7]